MCGDRRPEGPWLRASSVCRPTHRRLAGFLLPSAEVLCKGGMVGVGMGGGDGTEGRYKLAKGLFEGNRS